MPTWAYRFVDAQCQTLATGWQPAQDSQQGLSVDHQKLSMATYATLLGQEGWELVTALPSGSSGGTQVTAVFVFKKPA
jgi:hypothetical protein